MAKRTFKTPPGPPKGSLFPDRWVSGPDYDTHLKYRQWLQQKNQAQWRNETWNLTFDEWCQSWGDLYEERGRAPNQYCMSRDDLDGPWTVDNVIVITRKEHYLRNQQMSVHKRKRNTENNG